MCLHSANQALAHSVARSLADPFADFPVLKAFDLHADDGHFHAGAPHDPRDAKVTKYPTQLKFPRK